MPRCRADLNSAASGCDPELWWTGQSLTDLTTGESIVMKQTCLLTAILGMALLVPGIADSSKSSATKSSSKSVERICPVSGEEAGTRYSSKWRDGKVYFSASAALTEFEKAPKDFAEQANHQLVMTGQYAQHSCPVCEKKELLRSQKASVRKVPVYFSSEKCRKEFLEHSTAEKMTLAFSEKVFADLYETPDAPEKGDSSASKKSSTEKAAASSAKTAAKSSSSGRSTTSSKKK